MFNVQRRKLDMQRLSKNFYCPLPASLSIRNSRGSFQRQLSYTRFQHELNLFKQKWLPFIFFSVYTCTHTERIYFQAPQGVASVSWVCQTQVSSNTHLKNKHTCYRHVLSGDLSSNLLLFWYIYWRNIECKDNINFNYSACDTNETVLDVMSLRNLGTLGYKKYASHTWHYLIISHFHFPGTHGVLLPLKEIPPLLLKTTLNIKVFNAQNAVLAWCLGVTGVIAEINLASGVLLPTALHQSYEQLVLWHIQLNALFIYCFFPLIHLKQGEG